MDVLKLLKKVRDMIADGSYRTQVLDFFNAVMDLAKLTGNVFLTNSETPSGEMLVQQPFTDAEIIQRLDELIESQESVPDGADALTIPPAAMSVLAFLLQQAAQAVLRKLVG